jgi:hypothetical protein
MSGVTDLGVVLSAEELQEVVALVLENKQSWTSISEYTREADGHPLYTLGSPLYLAGMAIDIPTLKEQRAGENYKKPNEVNPYLTPSVRSIYKYFRKRSHAFFNAPQMLLLEKKLVSRLEQLYGLPARRHPNGSPPGFHVFNGVSETSYVYHIDGVLNDFNNDHRYDVFKSCVVAIKLSSSKTDGLDFKDDGVLKNIRYTEGHMYLWRADMPHKLADVSLLTPDDYRITYQLHFFKTPTELLYYW